MTDGTGTARTSSRPVAEPVEAKVPFAFVHINKCAGSSIEIALGIAKRHATAIEMRADLGPAEWDRRFTFSFVRNPFDRVASIYFYRVRTNSSGLVDRHLSFNAWVRKVWGERDAAYRTGTMLEAPAAEWLYDGERLLVDFVGRTERIDEDWALVCKTLGIDRPLWRTNVNHRPHYRLLYQPDTRAIIEQAFADDLNRFDFDY